MSNQVMWWIILGLLTVLIGYYVWSGKLSALWQSTKQLMFTPQSLFLTVINNLVIGGGLMFWIIWTKGFPKF